MQKSRASDVVAGASLTLAGCVTTGMGGSREETGSPPAGGGDGKEIDDGECKWFSFDAVLGGGRGKDGGDSSVASGGRRVDSGLVGYLRGERQGVKDETRKADMDKDG